MDFLLNYWYIIVAGLALAAVAVIYAVDFYKKSSDEQIAKVREWLLYAVMEAEKMFGSKTGVLKLRYVYDMFVKSFPWVAKMLSFEAFSDLVDKALEKMEEKLKNNDALAEYVASK